MADTRTALISPPPHLHGPRHLSIISAEIGIESNSIQYRSNVVSIIVIIIVVARLPYLLGGRNDNRLMNRLFTALVLLAVEPPPPSVYGLCLIDSALIVALHFKRWAARPHYFSSFIIFFFLQLGPRRNAIKTKFRKPNVEFRVD